MMMFLNWRGLLMQRLPHLLLCGIVHASLLQLLAHRTAIALPQDVELRYVHINGTWWLCDHQDQWPGTSVPCGGAAQQEAVSSQGAETSRQQAIRERVNGDTERQQPDAGVDGTAKQQQPPFMGADAVAAAAAGWMDWLLQAARSVHDLIRAAKHAVTLNSAKPQRDIRPGETAQHPSNSDNGSQQQPIDAGAGHHRMHTGTQQQQYEASHVASSQKMFLPSQRRTSKDSESRTVVQRLWPDHCIAGTRSAELHPDLLTAGSDVMVHKGTRPHIDSYSAFFDNAAMYATSLGQELRRKGVTDLYIAGGKAENLLARGVQD